MYVGSYGFPFIVTSNLDLTAATDVSLRIIRPDGSGYDRSLPDDITITIAATGTIAYVFQDGDLTVTGIYRGQVLDTTGGREIMSSIFGFRVTDALPDPPTPPIS